MASPSDDLKNGLMREGCFAARIAVALMLDAIIIAIIFVIKIAIEGMSSSKSDEGKTNLA